MGLSSTSELPALTLQLPPGRCHLLLTLGRPMPLFPRAPVLCPEVSAVGGPCMCWGEDGAEATTCQCQGTRRAGGVSRSGSSRHPLGTRH